MRIEIDSKPEEIDKLERKIMELQIARQALLKERDDAGREKLKKVDDEIAGLNKELEAKKKIWHNEKELITRISRINSEIEGLKAKTEELQKAAQLERWPRCVMV